MGITTSNNNVVGLDFQDVSEFTAEHFATQLLGTGTIGIKSEGRELITLRRLSLKAAQPIVIADNPVSTIDSDQTAIEDAYLIPAAGQNNITVNTGVNVSNLNIMRGAWSDGANGFYFSDTTSATTGFNLSIRDVRWEQESAPTGYMVYLAHNTGFDNVKFENLYGGMNARGFYLRKSRNISLDTDFYLGSGVCLDIASSTVDKVNLSNFTCNDPSATISLAGATNVYGRYWIGGTSAGTVLPIGETQVNSDTATGVYPLGVIQDTTGGVADARVGITFRNGIGPGSATPYVAAIEGLRTNSGVNWYGGLVFKTNPVDAPATATTDLAEVGRFVATTGDLSFAHKISVYNGIATVESGLPASHWNATSLTNGANIGGTNLIASAAAGRYRLSCYVAVTQQATTSSILPDCNLICTDPTDSVAKTIQVVPAIAGVAVNPTTGVGASGSGICDAKSATAVPYSPTRYMTVGATPMQYKLYIILEAM